MTKTLTRKDIIVLPNPHLRQSSKKINAVTEDIRQLVANMQAATLDWEDHRQHEVSVALAAIQIDKPLRAIIVRSKFDNKDDRSFNVLINPKITKFEGKIESDFEGCLSITDVYGKVPRYSKVRVKALDLDGKEFRLSAEGFLARVLQHEIDHTNGIVFVDHIKSKPKAFYKLTDGGKLELQDYAKDIKDNKDLWS